MEANGSPENGNCACQAPGLALPPDTRPFISHHQSLTFAHKPLAFPPLPHSDLALLIVPFDSRLLCHILAPMNSLSAPMDIDSPSYSRWSYATSHARLEAGIPVLQIQPRLEPQPVQRPPPTVVPPSPVQTSPGVWEDGDGVYYASNWPPVQEYLDRIRKERRMLMAPSEIVFVLAALDVLYSPCDVAHWIFWPNATYYNTADRVTTIALHQPRLIVTKVPWIGSREYRWIVNAIQEKYYYVHILGKWYPTDFQPLETKKRALRSSGAIEDRLDMTVNQFFNIIEDGLPPSKRQRRPSRKIADQVVPDDKRPRGTVHRRNTVTTPPEPATPLKNATPAGEGSACVAAPRSGRRVKQTPSLPAVDTAEANSIDSEVNPISPFTAELSSTISHSRNRSTSQSSEQTVVAEDRRSLSVESATTAVASSSLSKKRKAEVLDEIVEENDLKKPESLTRSPPEGMVTRSKNARISGVCHTDVKKSSARLSPVTRRTKSTPKPKSRKLRS